MTEPAATVQPPAEPERLTWSMPLVPPELVEGSDEWHEFMARVLDKSRHPVWNMPDPVVVTAAHVPDLPCPKCGSPEVRIRYAAADNSSCAIHRDECPWYGAEHFHRHCQRCTHIWFTLDVLPAGVHDA